MADEQLHILAATVADASTVAKMANGEYELAGVLLELTSDIAEPFHIPGAQSNRRCRQARCPSSAP